MKRILATTALAGALTLTGAAAASAVTADSYPASPARGGVNTGTTTPGGSVDFSGSGFTPGETVGVTVSCTTTQGGTSTSTGSAAADGRGTFTYTAVFNAAGQCSLKAVGAASGATVTAQVTVAGQAAAGPVATGTDKKAALGAGLANTGIDTPLALWGAAGVGALTLGAASVTVARRRSTIAS